MSMVQVVFLLVDVPNNRIDDRFVVLTEDVNKARDFVADTWRERIKPELGVHMFELANLGVIGVNYKPTERARW